MPSDPEQNDAVFRALADPTRRALLDLIKARPGATVGQLAQGFDVTRFAVMKHLRVLEEANLVVRRRDGRQRRLYLNAVPIQTIADRWMSKFSARWGAALTSLKYRLEDGDEPRTDAASEQRFAVTIEKSAADAWGALVHGVLEPKSPSPQRESFARLARVELFDEDPAEDGEARCQLVVTLAGDAADEARRLPRLLESLRAAIEG